jgi:uncharacterized protein (DUF488 family)
MSNELFTIGHSNHTIEEFLSLLRKHSITAVADVRSVPYSQYNPQFNREAIETSLKNNSIGYVFLGKELGARPDDPSCYTQNQVNFNLLTKKKFFINGIHRIIHGIEQNHRIVLMCSEKDPLFCHRTVLICRYLKRFDLEIEHVLYDGQLERHPDTETRLMESTKTEPTLFDQNKEVLINSAYDVQAEKISYVKEGV